MTLNHSSTAKKEPIASVTPGWQRRAGNLAAATADPIKAVILTLPKVPRGRQHRHASTVEEVSPSTTQMVDAIPVNMRHGLRRRKTLCEQTAY